MLLQRNLNQLDHARSAYATKLLSPRKSNLSALFLDYDYQLGRGIAQLPDGSKVFGVFDTNGGIGQGRRIALTRPRNSLTASFDAMPH